MAKPIIYAAAFPKYSKIGVTTQLPKRIHALQCERGKATIAGTWKHKEPMLIEHIVILLLKDYKADFGREWFTVPIEGVVRAVEVAMTIASFNDFSHFTVKDFPPSLRWRVKPYRSTPRWWYS